MDLYYRGATGIIFPEYYRPFLTFIKTVVCGVIAGFGLPNNIGTARYLSPQEREIANDRLLLDKPSLGDGTK
jgi:hypothetical protein